jgi:hypothetical protein
MRWNCLTGGGSTKLPRGNGSLIKTVYDGSADMIGVVIRIRIYFLCAKAGRLGGCWFKGVFGLSGHPLR